MQCEGACSTAREVRMAQEVRQGAERRSGQIPGLACGFHRETAPTPNQASRLSPQDSLHWTLMPLSPRKCGHVKLESFVINDTKCCGHNGKLKGQAGRRPEKPIRRRTMTTMTFLFLYYYYSYNNVPTCFNDHKIPYNTILFL